MRCLSKSDGLIMIDRDYMRGINMDYRDGYNKGRTDMLKECVIALCLVGFVIMLFSGNYL